MTQYRIIMFGEEKVRCDTKKITYIMGLPKYEPRQDSYTSRNLQFVNNCVDKNTKIIRIQTYIIVNYLFNNENKILHEI